ncbi:hypothetical protein [Kitasatospora sp. NPDC057223]|uniref:hypothetical protein n=1 Tax=Kitasatospora sp. NPDC057223 TaxID=3346055 RepID=UPI0036266D8A
MIDARVPILAPLTNHAPEGGAMRIAFNPAALSGAAAEAGDTMRSGRLNYELIARRAGLDRAVVSRVHRGVNPPDLRTALALALAYELPVERLVSIQLDLAAVA